MQTQPCVHDLFVGIDHVLLAGPPGCEAAARRFYGEILGLPEIAKPEPLCARGGVWFQCGAHQLHIGVDAAFVAARKAHPAFQVRDIDLLRERLTVLGIAVRNDTDLPGATRFYVDDPFGNRLEFVSRGTPTTSSGG